MRKKAGRPKGEQPPREEQVHFYLRRSDAKYFVHVAERFGFRSRSAMFTAIAERLALGEMSGMAFVKTGWQFSNLPAMKHADGTFWGWTPFPPLLEDQHDETLDSKLVPFIEGIKQEAKTALKTQEGKVA